MTASTPMPEPKWGYRRLVVYAVVLAILVALHRLIGLMPASDLAPIARQLIWLLGLVLSVYLIGPTAEHIIAGVRAWKGAGS